MADKRDDLSDLWEAPILLTANSAVPLSLDAVSWIAERIGLDELDVTLAEFDGPLGARSRAVCIPDDELHYFECWLARELAQLREWERTEPPHPELIRLHRLLVEEGRSTDSV